jgi:FKBP-type peptidyl-prolyl cis-trans isomerase 2
VVVRYGATKPVNPAEMFMVGSGELDPTLEAAVKGMKVGGKRKLGEIEIELIKIL